MRILHSGKQSSNCTANPLDSARNDIARTISSIISLTSTGASTNSIVPVSIFDRSRISLINWRSKSLLFSMIWMYSSFSLSSSTVASSFEKPTIAFSGVRISWLILARNTDLRRLDSSACSFVSINSCSICLRLVIICREPTKVDGAPFSSRPSTVACTSTQLIWGSETSRPTTRYSSWIFWILPFSRSSTLCCIRFKSSLCILSKHSFKGIATLTFSGVVIVPLRFTGGAASQ